MVEQQIKLTTMQESFAQNYILCGNAYKAAILAGYAKTTAGAKSSQWLEKVGIKERIETLRQSIAEQTTFTVSEWLKNVMQTEQKAKDEGNFVAVQRAQEMEAKYLVAYERDNEQKATKPVMIVNFADIDVNG